MTNDAFDRAVARERFNRSHRRRGSVAWGCFLAHLKVYVFVNLLLAAIWLVEAMTKGERELWFLEVALWWGVGLFAHYIAVRRARPRNSELRSDHADRHGGARPDGREHDDPPDPRGT